jgi:hypothetical protein
MEMTALNIIKGSAIPPQIVVVKFERHHIKRDANEGVKALNRSPASN